MQYRVLASRHDIPESVIDEFEAGDDVTAQARFQRSKENPNNAWNYLRLIEFTERVVNTSEPSERRSR